MNLDELQSVQSRERQTDQLQQLRATFYEEAGQFVQQLRDERDRAAERAEDPFDSPEVNRLTDDIKTAEQTVEAIYERRVGKIVKMASLAAADMPTEDDGLTQEERHLFETMVTAIEENRDHVLDVIAGEAPAGAVGDGADSTAPASASGSAERDRTDGPPAGRDAPAGADASDESPTGVDAADLMGGDGPSGGGRDDAPEASDPGDAAGTDPEASAGSTGRDGGTTDAADRPAEAEAAAAVGDVSETETPTETGGDGTDDAATPGGVDRTTVRITDDVGEIFGVDQREYDLSADDVVTLPADNAEPLVERDAAERLE
ncbi:hypothetical protein [Haloarcula litorea]|uniref:DNA replication complex subunit Gins51 n=1 Tax=Haloarcula litorea TaxID=3032579 RepID=UPI0023E7592C|nr:hypothetical protein [Halomicroarcula sp. GDY20]